MLLNVFIETNIKEVIVPSNKNKEKLQRTGKNELIFPALSIVPSLDKEGKAVYNIVKITFTMKGQCVTIETVDKATNEFEALVKFNNALLEDIGDIKEMRKIVKELKEEKNETKTKV